MSRTLKDRPSRVQHTAWDIDYIWNDRYGYRKAKTSKPKLRRAVDTEDHWMSTPSWWTHLCMIKPQRRAGRIWEASFVNSYIDMWELEEVDAPGVSNKPHIYYY